ncbi:MAG: hypothetical protein KJ626_11735 [Verrucomicrobia bacterium]|nr:hypothetical protein [Verrucomicrobiota bacterium]
MKYRAKHVIEYGLLRLVADTVGFLPYHAALAVGWTVAWLAHYVARFRREIACERLREVLGDLPAKQIRHIAWISWRNLCFNVIELMRMPRINRDWIEKVSDTEGLSVINDAIKDGRGAILGTMHMGNWDLAGVALHLFDIPIFFIARRQKNPLADEYLNRMRGVTGVETVLSDSSALKNVIRNLKKGKVLAILPDVRSRQESLSIRFFGKEANIAAGMAMFARQANVPVIPGYITRKGWGRHQWHVLDPIYPDLDLDKKEDWRRMTQQIMDMYDQIIRENPEQYFWYNKRWILDPL